LLGQLSFPHGEGLGFCQGRTHFSLQLQGILMGGGCASGAGQLEGVTSVGQFYFRRRLFGARDKKTYEKAMEPDGCACKLFIV
jgi:hypothetical protein